MPPKGKAMPVKATSLGLFILDSFEYLDSFDRPLPASSTSPVNKTSIGGGGTYCMIGARIFLESESVGLLIDRGTDWNEDLQKQLDHFGKEMWVYRDVDRLTTRALNRYRGEVREFHYLTPRSPLEPIDLPAQLQAEYLHFVCSPARAQVILKQMKESPNWKRTKLIYEPIDNSCTSDNLEDLKVILQEIDYFSPNHEEAAGFFGIPQNEVLGRGKIGIEQDAKKFIELGAKNVIIRSGALGCYVLETNLIGKWIEAFWQDQKYVIDVTGGGNSFLGGLMAGLVIEKRNLELAAIYGSVASSFIIEQFGLPVYTNKRWNGCLPSERVEDLRKRSGC